MFPSSRILLLVNSTMRTSFSVWTETGGIGSDDIKQKVRGAEIGVKHDLTKRQTSGNCCVLTGLFGGLSSPSAASVVTSAIASAIGRRLVCADDSRASASRRVKSSEIGRASCRERG